MRQRPELCDPDPDGYHFVRKGLSSRRFLIPGRSTVDTFVGCTLAHCDINVLVGPKRSRSPVEFFDCLIAASSFHVAAGKVLEAPFTNTAFVDCTFAGTLRSCEFGDVPHSRGLRDDGEAPDVVNCAFDDAVLQGCVFYACSLHTCRLPPWPHVMFRNPSQHRAAIRALRLPPTFSVAKESAGALSRDMDEVLVWHLPSIDPNCDLTRVRRVLGQLSCVEFPD